MNKIRKAVIIAALLTAAVILLSSCTAPNTVSTGTKYKVTMIGSIKDSEENTVSGSIWRALKTVRLKINDEETDDKWAAVKYYTPASVSGSETVSYSSAFTAAAKKQLELAAAGGAEIIVLCGDEYTDAYLEIKDVEKTYGKITFVILTVPSSKAASSANLNAKTTAVVLDNRQYGYLFGYFAVKNGNGSVGYIGASGTASEDFLTGLKKGVADAGGDPENVISSLTSSGPVESVILTDLSPVSGADIIIGDELTMSYVAASGKKYASIYEDEKAEFSISLNSTVLTGKLVDIIEGARHATVATVNTLGAEDIIFVYSGSEQLPEIPDFDAQ